MNLPTLTPERQDAFDAMLARYNATVKIPLTPEEYAEAVVLGVIDSEVKVRFVAAVDLLGSSAADAPYDQRIGMITLNAALAQLSDEDRATKIAAMLALLQ